MLSPSVLVREGCRGETKQSNIWNDGSHHITFGCMAATGIGKPSDIARTSIGELDGHSNHKIPLTEGGHHGRPINQINVGHLSGKQIGLIDHLELSS